MPAVTSAAGHVVGREGEDEAKLKSLEALQAELVRTILNKAAEGLLRLMGWKSLTHHERMYLIARQRKLLKKLVRESLKEIGQV